MNNLLSEHFSPFGADPVNAPWNTGAPPCVGWWNASAVRDRHIWRHWNGWGWSGVVAWGPEVGERYYPRPAALMERVTGAHTIAPLEWRHIQPPWN